MSLQQAESVSLSQKPIDAAGQSIFHIRFGLQRIVKNYYRTVPCIFFHVVEYFIRIYQLTIVTGYHIPHNYFIVTAQDEELRHSHMSVRRTKQARIDIFRSKSGIFQIPFRKSTYSLYMVESMITYTVTPVEYHLVYIGMLAYIIAYAEESSLNVIFIQ